MTDSVDSIQEAIANAEQAQDDGSKASLLNQLAHLVAEESGGLMRAIAYSETALELASKQNPPNMDCLAESLESLGEFYLQTNSADLVLAYILKVRSFLDLFTCATIPENLSDEQAIKARFCARMLALLGKTFANLGEYGQAVDDYVHAQQVFHMIGDGVDEAAVLNSIGEVYIKLDRSHEALQFLSEGLQTAQDVEGQAQDDTTRLASIEIQANLLDNMCRTYLSMDDLDKAVGSGLLSIQLFRQLCLYVDEPKQRELQRGEARALNNLGYLYIRLDAPHNYDPKKPRRFLPWGRALVTFQQAYDLTQVHVARQEKIAALLGLGDVHRLRHEYDQAIERLNQAAELATGINTRREQYEVHRSLSQVYKETGDFPRALEHYEQFHALRDQAFNQESARRLRNLELVHQADNARKEAEISQLRNITLQNEIMERKAAEQNLIMANQLLQEEIEVKELLISDLDAFAHMVAHDLKAPLTNMALSAGLVRTLLGQIQPSLETAVLRRVQTGVMPSVDKITWMVGKMNRIITELLVLASVQSEHIQTAPLDMAAVVKEARNRLSYLIDEYQAEIELPDAWPSAMGHAPWVEEVWANYISNAVVYGGKPPRITLGAETIRVASPENGEYHSFVRYWVQDNGQGLTVEQQSHLFTKFGRSQDILGDAAGPDDTKATGHKSHGLGLSIARRIVERLGGSVGVQSEGIPGCGSQFYFTLPGVPGE